MSISSTGLYGFATIVNTDIFVRCLVLKKICYEVFVKQKKRKRAAILLLPSLSERLGRSAK
jgi:hypothetical protein